MSYTVTLSSEEDRIEAAKSRFRVGFVTLAIPPDGISFNKVSNNDEVMPMRAKFAQHIKTGHSRWDVTISWKALLGMKGNDIDWSQWEDVRSIVAMIKAAPFVEVENEDVRRFFAEKDPTIRSHAPRLAFALRHLVVTTSEDMIDGLDCNLTMSLFNYLPYTHDFAYSQSGLKRYIEVWKAENLDRPYNRTAKNEEIPAPWKSQDPHTMEFVWRKYYVQKGTPSQVDKAADTKADGLLKDLKVDHYTSKGDDDCVTFRYARRRMRFTANDVDGHFVEKNPHNTFIQQISVVFASNIAFIPLSGYQYPTNQHLGPAGTMVSIALQQKGYESSGIPSITEMLSGLEEQFLSMRTQWRSTSSIHRMQAMFCTNQVLNMLGVFGLMQGQLTFENVKESSDLIQGQLVASQYENVFESLEPYKVKGPLADYADAFEDMFSKAKTLGLLPSEQTAGSAEPTPEKKQYIDAIKPIADFHAARQKNDYKWMRSFIQSHKDIPALIAGMVPMPVTLNDCEKEVLARAATVMMKDFPYLKDRAKGKDISFVEYFVIAHCSPSADVSASAGVMVEGVPDAKPDNLEPVMKTVEADAEKTNRSLQALYTKVFQLLCSKDNAFKGALEKMLQNPALNQTFREAGGGVFSDGDNWQHGAYRDLGVRGLGNNGNAYEPADYFHDYSLDIQNQTAQNLKSLIPQMLKGYQELNKGPDGATAPVFPSELTIAESNPYGIMQRAMIPLFSMKAAFPTYKLFLMEEDNSGVYYCFDDFYTYASVIEIETEDHKDRGSTAVITLTNLASLLSHKLFDGSTLGKLEHQYHKFLPKQAMSSDGSATTGLSGVATGVSASEDFDGTNLQESINSNGRPQSIPLKYFALQAGSKLQIRMGYSDNPDELTPVFQGVVTEVEGDDVLTITAQGFQTELMKPSPDTVQADGYSPVGVLGQELVKGERFITDLLQLDLPGAFRNLVSAVSIPKAPAYGGLRIFGETGGATGVMSAMLKASGAKHFGHWQVAQATDPFIKGFTWSECVGSWMDQASTVGAYLRAAYDRRDENVLVNHLVNYDGSHTPGAFKRSFSFETPTMLLPNPPEYYIPDAAVVTPWQVIKDIGRRFPEYVLTVKPYGFPFQADATLVFAHPMDWYYSRLPFVGEDLSASQVKDTDAPYFDDALNKTGLRKRFIETWNKYCQNDPSTTANHAKWGSGLKERDFPGDVILKNIGNSPSAFERKVSSIVDQINSSPKAIISTLPGHFFADDVKEARNAFIGIINDVRKTVAFLRDPSSSLRPSYTERVKPVRRFHFVDHRSIVHNGITVNDRCNNTVQLAGQTFAANEMIPAHHRRVVCVDDQILNPKDNCPPDKPEFNIAYAQSFLRDEVGKMYRGDLVLRLTPEIEKFDVVMVTDPATGMVGPIEVESVMHIMNQEMGAVTIVRPRALVLINEAATASFLGALWQSINTASAWGPSFVSEMQNMSGLTKGVTYAGGALVGAAAVAGLTTLAIFGGPAGWVVGALIVGGALSFISGIAKTLNPVLVAPLMRFGKPWIGGLEGYRIADMGTWAIEMADRFVTEEIAPTIESYKLLVEGLNPFNQNQQHADTSWLPNINVITPAPKGAPKGEAFIERWAQAIKQHEGWVPAGQYKGDKRGSPAYRNNNPGNIRMVGDLGRDENGFARFSSPAKGYEALKNDLRDKVRKYADYSVLKITARYAPPKENDTLKYARAVAGKLGVPITTSIGSLYSGS